MGNAAGAVRRIFPLLRRVPAIDASDPGGLTPHEARARRPPSLCFLFSFPLFRSHAASRAAPLRAPSIPPAASSSPASPQKPNLPSPPPQNLAAPPPPQLRGEIELRDVHFAYPSRAVAVFSGFSLRAPPGATTALVGESGSGKSSIIALIERCVRACAGLRARVWGGFGEV